MSVFLKVNELFGGYGKDLVLKNISFEVREGEFLGVIGPNGSGKSTLLKLMSRVISAQKGKILLEGEDIAKVSLKKLCQKIAFVPQQTTINFSFTAWEIVLMGRIPYLKRLQFETKRDFEVAEQSLSLTDVLQLKDKKIDALSAGERQRVIIAKALAQEPVLLFLDEPTSHLDIGHQEQILSLLRKLNQRNKLTVIIVLHDLNLASHYCQRLILLDKGEIFKSGEPEEVLTYQNIEEVYNTLVVVNRNPVSGKPYIISVSREEKCQ